MWPLCVFSAVFCLINILYIITHQQTALQTLQPTLPRVTLYKEQHMYTIIAQTAKPKMTYRKWCKTQRGAEETFSHDTPLQPTQLSLDSRSSWPVHREGLGQGSKGIRAEPSNLQVPQWLYFRHMKGALVHPASWSWKLSPNDSGQPAGGKGSGRKGQGITTENWKQHLLYKRQNYSIQQSGLAGTGAVLVVEHSVYIRPKLSPTTKVHKDPNVFLPTRKGRMSSVSTWAALPEVSVPDPEQHRGMKCPLTCLLLQSGVFFAFIIEGHWEQAAQRCLSCTWVCLESAPVFTIEPRLFKESAGIQKTPHTSEQVYSKVTCRRRVDKNNDYRKKTILLYYIL